MKKKQLTTINGQAAKLCLKIDAFIDEIKKENSSFAGLIALRLFKKCDESEITDIFWEIKYDVKLSDENLNDLSDMIEIHGRKVITAKSLADEITIDNFIQHLEENPYQLKLIA